MASNESKYKAWIARIRDCYKLTPEKVLKVETFQRGVCFICGARPAGKRLAIDHAWATGLFRGNLCGRCNTQLGKIERGNRGSKPWTISELKRVILYLENPPATQALGEPHYGYPGNVHTKKHRKFIKKLKKEQAKNGS